MKRRWLWMAVTTVFTLGVVAQWMARFEMGAPQLDKIALGMRLPSAVEGWSVAAQPIADTPEMKRAVGEQLNYDDAVFLSYLQGPWRFAVYAAYWRPGRMPRREVASHTPDVCWLLSGWLSAEQDFDYVLKIDGQLLRPAQRRVFTMGAQPPQHVLFWHLADGDLVTYRGGRGVGWWATATDVFQYGVGLKPEQLFLRISSDTPFGQLEQLDGFRRVVRSLLPLGLIAETKPAK